MLNLIYQTKHKRTIAICSIEGGSLLIVESPEDYKYSSYKYYAEGKANHLITSDFMYKEMGSDNSERQAARVSPPVLKELILI